MSKNLWDFLPTVKKWFDAENLKTYQKEAKQLFWWRLLVPTTCPNYMLHVFGTKKNTWLMCFSLDCLDLATRVFFLKFILSARERLKEK